MTGGRTAVGLDPGVAPAAICRAVLLSRAALALTAAGAGLLLVTDRWRVVAVLALVALVTVAEVSALTRWPSVVRRPGAVIAVDLVAAVAVLVLSGGGMAYFSYAAGTAALAGALLRMRALPLWVAQAVLGFGVAAVVLRTHHTPPELAAFVVALPMVSVLAGLGASAATAALVRYIDLAVRVVAAAQRSAAASERARLARELHDSVAKTLRGVSLAALALPQSLRRHPALAEQLAGTVSQGAEVAAREARELMEGLRIDQLDREFDEVVHQICRAWAARTGIRVSVVAQPVEPPVALRYELSRILQEALQNVARHAHAGRVVVRLVGSGGDGGGGGGGGGDAGELMLSVADDGIGFTPRDLGAFQRAGHFGLVGMAERARTVGGTLEVHSAPGSGTVVTARVPAVPPPLLTDPPEPPR